MDSAKRVLGVDILLGCPYESCCLCHKVGHAGRDCRLPEPDDLPDLLTAWMCAPWLHHSNTYKVFHPGAADLKAAQAEVARLKTALVESGSLRTAADAEVARLRAERVSAANSVKCGRSGDLEFIVDEPVRALRVKHFELLNPGAPSLRKAIEQADSSNRKNGFDKGKSGSGKRAPIDTSNGFDFEDLDVEVKPELKLYPGLGCNGPGVLKTGKGCPNSLLKTAYRTIALN